MMRRRIITSSTQQQPSRIITRQILLLKRCSNDDDAFFSSLHEKCCSSDCLKPSSSLTSTLQRLQQQQQQRRRRYYYTTIATKMVHRQHHHHQQKHRYGFCCFGDDRRHRQQQNQNQPLLTILSHRHNNSRYYYHELSYDKHGEPLDVLEYKNDLSIKDDYSPDTNNMIKVEMLHVPWNPADVNTIQGKYPYPSGFVKPEYINKSRYFNNNNNVLGSEGLGRVVVDDSAGSSKSKSSFEEGSLVTFRQPGLGTLRSSIWLPESSLIQVPSILYEKAGPAGCTLFQLGGTAYRLLHDFVNTDLKPGEIIIQNGGNSGVGLMISQIANTMLDLHVVSLIRRGSKTTEQFDSVVKYLKSVGKNSLVIAEEDLYDNPSAIKELQLQLKDLSSSSASGSGGGGSDLPQQPRLALNGIGGDSSNILLKLLGPSGTMVTYGGMSGKPVIVATPQLIFKDLHIHGYWHSRWMLQNLGAKEQRQNKMIDNLIDNVLNDNIVCLPVKVYKLKDYQKAINWHSNQTDGIRKKLVFDCQEE